MTPDQFRHLALGQFGARGATRLGAMDFLVGDKVFASLGLDAGHAVLRLSPQAQAQAIARAPKVFFPQPGGAGVRGVTGFRLALATEEDLKPTLSHAAFKARNARSSSTQLP